MQGVLLDQFGVLHDGKSAYPAAIEAVQQWSRMGLKVYILSNSSRRAGTCLTKIGTLGFHENWFAGNSPNPPPPAPIAQLCFFLDHRTPFFQITGQSHLTRFHGTGCSHAEDSEICSS